MRLGRCPVCHAHLHLDALVQDEAGRELLGLCATLPDELGRALVAYLALWRPARGDLDNARALRLAREVLALQADPVRLAWALAETVEGIRAKGEARRMTNHNYLRRVLEGAPVAGAVAVARVSAVRRRLSATEEAILAIRQVGVESDTQAHAHGGAHARAQGGQRSLGRELDGLDDDAIDV